MIQLLEDRSGMGPRCLPNWIVHSSDILTAVATYSVGNRWRFTTMVVNGYLDLTDVY